MGQVLREHGHAPISDEDKALASWRWRCLHYAHGEEGRTPLYDADFAAADNVTRDYWTGLFAHGFGLCGATHAQWAAEFEALLGPGRSRVCGVAGHNSHEVFLADSNYGGGKWVLLDHDVATVVFGPRNGGLLGIADVLKPANQPFQAGARQGQWPRCGLHPDDHSPFSALTTVEYRAGYAGAPPRVHLRPGETFRRDLRPGLEDGKTFVYGGRNMNAGGIPGPARDRSFVNDAEGFRAGKTAWKEGRARYGNAVFTWKPRFRELGISRLEFASPYVIAAQPANAKPWGVYEPGGTLGVVVRNAKCKLVVGSPRVKPEPLPAQATHDLTDAFKGARSWRIDFQAEPAELDAMGIEIVTICQANPATMPRLKDDGTTIDYEATGVVNTPAASMVLVPPKGDQKPANTGDSVALPYAGADAFGLQPFKNTAKGFCELHAVAHALSGNPPKPVVRYWIMAGTLTDGTPLVKDWAPAFHDGAPKDQWSQSFVWGSAAVDPNDKAPTIGFANTGKVPWRRLEMTASVAVDAAPEESLRVAFGYREAGAAGLKRAEHVVRGRKDQWKIDTGTKVATEWVEFAAP